MSLFGYASATEAVRLTGDTATLSFDLPASPIPLEAIVVTASPGPRPSADQYEPTASKIQVELLNSPGGSLAEKLADLPGVAARLNGSAPARPSLRGLGDNEVLVLENGLRTGDVAAFDPAHATPIEALGVSQVDVVRGPAAILDGPNTLGGVVNVITDMVPAVADRPVSGTAVVEANTVSDQYAGYLDNVFSGSHDALRVSAGGVHTQDIGIPSGSYVDPGSGMAFGLNRMPQTFDRSSEGGLGYTYQGQFGSLGVGGQYYTMDYGVPGVPPNPDWLTVPPTTSRISQDRTTLELRGLLNATGFAKQWKLDASYNDYGHSEFPTLEDSAGVSAPEANHFHKREFNGVLQLSQARRGHVDGTIGLWTDLADLTIEGDQPLGPNSVTTGAAVYAYEEYHAGPTPVRARRPVRLQRDPHTTGSAVHGRGVPGHHGLANGRRGDGVARCHSSILPRAHRFGQPRTLVPRPNRARVVCEWLWTPPSATYSIGDVDARARDRIRAGRVAQGRVCDDSIRVLALRQRDRPLHLRTSPRRHDPGLPRPAIRGHAGAARGRGGERDAPTRADRGDQGGR